MLRRWSKPALGLVYSLGRIDSGEFVTVLVGHAWSSLSLGGIVFYSNTMNTGSDLDSLSVLDTPDKIVVHAYAALGGELSTLPSTLCLSSAAA